MHARTHEHMPGRERHRKRTTKWNLHQFNEINIRKSLLLPDDVDQSNGFWFSYERMRHTLGFLFIQFNLSILLFLISIAHGIKAYTKHVPYFTVYYLLLLPLNRSHSRFCILYLNYFMLSVVLVCFVLGANNINVYAYFDGFFIAFLYVCWWWMCALGSSSLHPLSPNLVIPFSPKHSSDICPCIILASCTFIQFIRYS